MREVGGAAREGRGKDNDDCREHAVDFLCVNMRKETVGAVGGGKRKVRVGLLRACLVK